MRWILVLIYVGWLGATAAGAVAGDVSLSATNAASTNRTLAIEKSFAKIPGGKAALTVGLLRRTNDLFGGEFQLKVTPYFFKNDQGNLVITITADMIAKAAKGAEVEIAGTAKSARKNAGERQIKAIATPVDGAHGALKLWVMTDERKLFFETKYRFVEE